MLNNWINLLPLFIVKRIARKRGEVFTLGGVEYCQATDGVLVRRTSTEGRNTPDDRSGYSQPYYPG